MNKILFLALMLGGVCLLAQDAPAPVGGVPEGRPGAGLTRPSSRENMQALLLERVKKELELTPEQTGKYVELFYKGEELKQQYNKKRIELAEKIKTALKAEKIDEGALNGLIEDFKRLDREEFEKTKEMKDQGAALLNVQQKAKLLLLEARMRGGMIQNQGGRRPDRKAGGNKEESK